MSIEESPGAIWLAAYRAGAAQLRLNDMLGIDGAAKRAAMLPLGLTVARVEVMGDSWQEASGDAGATNAILWPVGIPAVLDRVVDDFCSGCLAIDPRDPAASVHQVVDVIAIVGRVALSLRRTAAIGSFAVDQGRCCLVSDPEVFLRRYLERFLGGDERTPDAVDTLIVDRTAFEWRLSEPGCVVPKDAALACVDSRELAAWLSKEMRKRAPVRKAPEVLAPKETLT